MPQTLSEQAQVEQLITKYIEGINQSSADKLLPLFTSDGVLMVPDAPTMNGADQIGAFFNHALSEVSLEAEIFFDETFVSGPYAYVRTHSSVSTTILQTKSTQTGENRELFICRKDRDEWKIARYMFTKLPSAV